MSPVYEIIAFNTPLIAVALHSGHQVDADVRSDMCLSEQERAREEDPYTDFLADLPVSKAIVHLSRFQVDLNRTPGKAIYRRPEDAWGLKVWRAAPDAVMEPRFMDSYTRFYEEMGRLIRQTIQVFGRFLVLDLHSYNYRRDDPFQAAPAAAAPEINLGTVHNPDKWRPLITNVKRYLQHHRIMGHPADVRENVIFKGGAFSAWVAENFGDYGPVLSLEFKKTFMDEWTGVVDVPHLMALKAMLETALPFLEYELSRVNLV